MPYPETHFGNVVETSRNESLSQKRILRRQFRSRPGIRQNPESDDRNPASLSGENNGVNNNPPGWFNRPGGEGGDDSGLSNGPGNNNGPGTNNGGTNNGGTNNGGTNNGGTNNGGTNNGGINNGGTNSGGTNNGGINNGGSDEGEGDDEGNDNGDSGDVGNDNGGGFNNGGSNSGGNGSGNNGSGSPSGGGGYGGSDDGISPSPTISRVPPASLPVISSGVPQVPVDGGSSPAVSFPSEIHPTDANFPTPTTTDSPAPSASSHSHPRFSNTAIIVTVLLSCLLVVSAVAFFLYRRLRSRRAESRIRWWWFSRRKSTPSFHDISPEASRGVSPTSCMENSPAASSSSHTTLPTMNFASPSTSPTLGFASSNQSLANMPPMMIETRDPLQYPFATVHHRVNWTDSDSMASSNTVESRRTTTENVGPSKHPLTNSESFLPRPLPPLPTTTNHTTVLSQSSFMSTALTYTDPFSDHARGGSTAFATSPEPMSSAPPSSDGDSTDSILSIPNTSSILGSDESEQEGSGIIIVSSSQYDDADSIDYHTTPR